MLTLDAVDAAELAQNRSVRPPDQDSPVRSKRAPVLPPGPPPGYPWRTFEMRLPVQLDEDAAHAQPHSDADHRYGWLSLAQERVKAIQSSSMRAWATIRSHVILSLCSCLALLLLTQVGAVSLMALQSHPLSAAVGRSDSAATNTSEARRQPPQLLERALSEALASNAAATASSGPPAAISGSLSSGTVATYNTVGQPCHDSTFFAATITQWTVPPGCYSEIYTPNPKNYHAVSGAFGWCNWWPEALHPTHADILTNSKYPHGTTPMPGAAIHFSPGVQGASMDGHYAQVVAVQPGSPWILVTEMNFTWRGGGFGKVDYRYVKVGPGMTFIYDM